MLETRWKTVTKVSALILPPFARFTNESLIKYGQEPEFGRVYLYPYLDKAHLDVIKKNFSSKEKPLVVKVDEVSSFKCRLASFDSKRLLIQSPQFGTDQWMILENFITERESKHDLDDYLARILNQSTLKNGEFVADNVTFQAVFSNAFLGKTWIVTNEMQETSFIFSNYFKNMQFDLKNRTKNREIGHYYEYRESVGVDSVSGFIVLAKFNSYISSGASKLTNLEAELLNFNQEDPLGTPTMFIVRRLLDDEKTIQDVLNKRVVGGGPDDIQLMAVDSGLAIDCGEVLEDDIKGDHDKIFEILLTNSKNRPISKYKNEVLGWYTNNSFVVGRPLITCLLALMTNPIGYTPSKKVLDLLIPLLKDSLREIDRVLDFRADPDKYQEKISKFALSDLNYIPTQIELVLTRLMSNATALRTTANGEVSVWNDLHPHMFVVCESQRNFQSNCLQLLKQHSPEKWKVLEELNEFLEEPDNELIDFSKRISEQKDLGVFEDFEEVIYSIGVFAPKTKLEQKEGDLLFEFHSYSSSVNCDCGSIEQESVKNKIFNDLYADMLAKVLPNDIKYDNEDRKEFFNSNGMDRALEDLSGVVVKIARQAIESHGNNVTLYGWGPGVSFTAKNAVLRASMLITIKDIMSYFGGKENVPENIRDLILDRRIAQVVLHLDDMENDILATLV